MEEKMDTVETRVEVTEDLVREIAGNLGAGKHLIEALIEKMWYTSPGGGFIHWQSVSNRDQAAALVDRQLANIWRRRD